MMRILHDFRLQRLLAVPMLLLLGLTSGCAPDYSPNVYGANAVQQANKVEQGVIVGVRKVDVAAGGTVGAASGAAAGGVLGSATPGGGISTALGTVGGALVGSLVGNAAEHAAADTTAFEYIVKKPNNELVSVTQRDKEPLAMGLKVLVIAGNQARIIPDITVSTADISKDSGSKDPGSKDPGPKEFGPKEFGKDGAKDAKVGTEPPPASVSATPLAPPPGASSSASSFGAGSSEPVVLTPVAPPSLLAPSPASPVAMSAGSGSSAIKTQ